MRFSNPLPRENKISSLGIIFSNPLSSAAKQNTTIWCLDCKRCCPFPQTQPNAQTRYLFNGDVDGRPDAHHLHLLLPHHLEDDLHPGLLHRSHHPHIPAAEAQFKGLQTSADIPRRLQTPSNAKRQCITTTTIHTAHWSFWVTSSLP